MNRLPRCIVVPVAFPHEERAAVELAAALAAALSAELVLAGIAPPAMPVSAGNGSEQFDTLARQVEQQRLVDRLVDERLQELAAELAARVRVRTLLTWGPIGPAMVETAREQHADLVVIPMRHESEWRHLVHDHADRHILHHCDVPVLVVPISAS